MVIEVGGVWLLVSVMGLRYDRKVSDTVYCVDIKLCVQQIFCIYYREEECRIRNGNAKKRNMVQERDKVKRKIKKRGRNS